MANLDKIKRPIEQEIETFEKKFQGSMKSSVPLLDKITHYIVKRKGKQIRPMFVFLSAKLFGDVNESSYNAAALIELLHTATLVHDDVVDDSHERRGFFSINALWKNKIAVLVGDYLLSKGLLLAISNKEFQLLQIVSEAVREMSEGELLQIEKTRNLNIDESIYFEIIRQKTATLISACCMAGAATTSTNADYLQLMKDFGTKAGIAFQLKDDLFDYGSGKKIGKPTGIDIKEKKTTLPLIFALNKANKAQRSTIINTVKNNNNDPKKVKEVIDFVLASGGIEYATSLMHQYADEALEILAKCPDNEARQSLHDLVLYTIEREH